MGLRATIALHAGLNITSKYFKRLLFSDFDFPCPFAEDLDTGDLCTGCHIINSKSSLQGIWLPSSTSSTLRLRPASSNKFESSSHSIDFLYSISFYYTNNWTWSIQPAMLETSSKTNQLPTSFRFIGKQGMKGALYFMDPTVNRYHQSCSNHGNVCEVIKTTSRHRFITPDSWQRLSHTNRL